MIGKMYEARKKSVGAQDGHEGRNQHTAAKVDKMSESAATRREIRDGTGANQHTVSKEQIGQNVHSADFSNGQNVHLKTQRKVKTDKMSTFKNGDGQNVHHQTRSGKRRHGAINGLYGRR